jgi:hypothetical protein
LDQVALPLVIHGLGGGRDALPSGFLDGTHSCHYRLMPLLFARESDHLVDTLREVAAPNKIKKVLKEYTPFKRMIYQKRDKRCAICLIVTTCRAKNAKFEIASNPQVCGKDRLFAYCALFRLCVVSWLNFFPQELPYEQRTNIRF